MWLRGDSRVEWQAWSVVVAKAIRAPVDGALSPAVGDGFPCRCGCGLAATQRIAQGRISWIEGTHLFPFEQPGKTVDAVLDWMARLDGAAAPA